MDAIDDVEFRPTTPPQFTIDLSQPPRERYRHVVAHYIPHLRDLTILFDDLLYGIGCPLSLLTPINKISKLLLRRVGTTEETEELRGISEQAGVPMYLLVSLNVILDLLMGCTSGGVQSLEARQPRSEARMLHFRTLDWWMDGLRDIIVQLDFIRSNSEKPEQIIASSVTYLGFNGFLTAVAPGLSLSLNFRALHDGLSWRKHFRFYFHHLLVLFGYRRSIASILRSYQLEQVHPAIDKVVEDFSQRHTTAAYITLCDGERTVVMEKDFSTARIHESNTFIAVTNHDLHDRRPISASSISSVDMKMARQQRQAAAMEDIMLESEARLQCIERKWLKKLQASRRSEQSTFVTTKELTKWVSDWPTTNECTHFAVIMDPKAGKVSWSQALSMDMDYEVDSACGSGSGDASLYCKN